MAAVFSAGFRLDGDSHGGWYGEGREARPLVPGAASLVLRRDGTADVGAWGTEVRMGPNVASVRQNLVPLVDGGQENPTCATGGVSGAYFRPRIDGPPLATRLFQDERIGAEHYLQPSTRDFYAFYLR